MKKIFVSNYNPNWVKDFETIKEVLASKISNIALCIEHVGSTSVPNLAAKPIIDIDIVASNKTDLELIIKELSSLGINHLGDLGIIGREAFTRLEGLPEHNLYACIKGALPLQNHLVIRDTLRSDSKLCEEYSKLKFELAKKHPYDIDSYVEGKSDFLLSILEKKGILQEDINHIRQVNKK